MLENCTFLKWGCREGSFINFEQDVFASTARTWHSDTYYEQKIASLLSPVECCRWMSGLPRCLSERLAEMRLGEGRGEMITNYWDNPSGGNTSDLHICRGNEKDIFTCFYQNSVLTCWLLQTSKFCVVVRVLVCCVLCWRWRE